MTEVNLIPKEYKKKKIDISGVFSKTGGIVLILFIISLLGYGGLLFYQKGVKEDLQVIEQERELVEQQIEAVASTETKEVIVALDAKLDVVKDLFESHLYWSRLFSKVEELTVPEAYFSKNSFKLSTISEEGKKTESKIEVSLAGNALSYTILARQILSFQEEPFVEDIAVSGIALSNEGGIEFDLAITFSKDILLSYD